MSGTGNCYDYAMVETFFKTLKSELVWRIVFYTRQEADQAIGATSTGSTIPSGAIPPSTSQARLSSKKPPPNESMPLH
jgi:transposase InsO family protein